MSCKDFIYIQQNAKNMSNNAFLIISDLFCVYGKDQCLYFSYAVRLVEYISKMWIRVPGKARGGKKGAYTRGGVVFEHF